MTADAARPDTTPVKADPAATAHLTTFPGPAPIESDAAIAAHVHAYHTSRCLASPLYAFLLSPETHGLRLTHASKGLVVFRLPLAACHLNTAGSLHGSVSATIVDWAGGLAIAAWDMRAQTGVSVDIHVTYVSGAKLGQEVEIEGRIDRVGGSLAFTNVGVYKVKDGERGEAVALGRHTKFVRTK